MYSPISGKGVKDEPACIRVAGVAVCPRNNACNGPIGWL
jgi:hypothetical protein